MASDRQLKVCALLAIAGGILNAASDLLLRCGPVSGREITFEYMATMPYGQTLAGAVLGGAIGTPMWLFALVPLYDALRSSGRGYAVPVVVVLAYLFVISAIYHSVFALFHIEYDLFVRAGTDGLPALAEAKQRVSQFNGLFMSLWALAALTGSVWFGVAIFRKKTAFPRWSVAVAPAACIPVSLASGLLPAPVGGYIRPMAGSLMMTLFFSVIARAVWRRRDGDM
jgi:hypothetical protein